MKFYYLLITGIILIFSSISNAKINTSASFDYWEDEDNNALDGIDFAPIASTPATIEGNESGTVSGENIVAGGISGETWK